MSPSGKSQRGSGLGRRGGLGSLAALLACAVLAAGAGPARAEEEAEAEPEKPAAAGDELPRSRRSTGLDAALLAPIGVTDSYALPAGEVAFSYRYSFVRFDDLRRKTSRRSTADVLQDFEQAPRDRDLQVHLFGVSWAPHPRVTLSAKLPFIVQETNVSARPGMGATRFETESKGIGDLELRVLVPFMRRDFESLQVDFGLTAPTGSYKKRDGDSDGTGTRLPFPQQLGSGTVDLLIGGVYRGRWETLTWGVVARSKFRLYENAADYRLGGEYMISAWLAQSWTDWLSTSLRTSWRRRDNVHPRTDAANNPERAAKRQAGDVLDVGPGVNFRLPWLGGPRLGVEVTWPYYQDLKGPQLEQDWTVTTGWKWSF